LLRVHNPFFSFLLLFCNLRNAPSRSTISNLHLYLVILFEISLHVHGHFLMLYYLCDTLHTHEVLKLSQNFKTSSWVRGPVGWCCLSSTHLIPPCSATSWYLDNSQYVTVVSHNRHVPPTMRLHITYHMLYWLLCTCHHGSTCHSFSTSANTWPPCHVDVTVRKSTQISRILPNFQSS
jgi:hypothetical protein